MNRKFSTPHVKAVLQALLVTLLWSSSWILIKIGLSDIPSILFAGIRYSLAFLCLLIIAIKKIPKAQFHSLSAGDWKRLMLLGFLFYGITQASQFIGLDYLPAVTVSVMLNFTSPLVAFLGLIILKETPGALQWVGIALFLIGVGIYFYPIHMPAEEILGLIIVFLGVIANSLSSILGRYINRSKMVNPLLITVISMGFGSIILLLFGISQVESFNLTLQTTLIVIWLSLINTAFAFTLWNLTLQTLTAVESSIINGTMLVQIALLAWVFLSESLTTQQLVGMVVLGFGAVFVQLKKSSIQQAT